MLRRVYEEASSPDILRTGDVVLDKKTRMVTVGTRKIELTPSEFDMLIFLMSAPGQVFTRTNLLERLKGDLFENVERTVDVHIRNLRAKLEPDPSNPQYILTSVIRHGMVWEIGCAKIRKCLTHRGNSSRLSRLRWPT